MGNDARCSASWTLLVCLLVLLLSCGLSHSFPEPFISTIDTDAPTVAPKFMTRGHLYKAIIGDSIELPCKVKDLGSYVLLWRRGTSVLTAANLMVTRDPRFKLVEGYNLQIANVKIQDAGDYICQIGDNESRDQVHTLEILVPPTIRVVPQNRQITARKGSTVTLECKASGNPVPAIYWHKKDAFSGSSHLSESPTLLLERVDRHHAGVYQCTADNGVREAVHVDIEVTVLSPPDITVEKTWVHASEGFDIDLVCIVHGDVNSEMLWYQNSFLLDPTDRRSMYSRGDKYTLNIRNFQQSDFGNYSCVADNALGRTKKYIEVSGRPGPAAFLSPAYSNYLDRYNLTYTIESIPPLDEIKLLYRKLMMNETYQHPGSWEDTILVPTLTRSDPTHFIMSHVIRGLSPNSVYEVMIQARNVHGWNEISDIHQFYTRNFELTPNELEFVMSSISNSGHRKPFSQPASMKMLLTCFITFIAVSFSLARC
ncbi:limbic system-associated membrane protein [Anopheles stephensi]|uniref:limbic system-associated membrane protein n=1 Tax=Anopheles stephensi TaxID=30069 RepID=UPI001658A886|nr:limbic system-associated membrane protein [Anopheles stephensi]XP_035903703.1 limbic system-associated membrane protein [Anopheles stephensi]